MPRIWSDTIDAHRRAVRDAILDTAAALAAGHGVAAVTMSRIAEEAGIGRATLYKYFPDLHAIIVAWHERRVDAHLEELAAVRDQAGSAAARLENVLATYARIAHEHDGTELAAMLHRGEHVAGARKQLVRLMRDLLAEAAATGELRGDVPPHELATYCLHALDAASSLASRAAVDRLVLVTLGGLRPPRSHTAPRGGAGGGARARRGAGSG